jgi:hypothetical protein
MPARIAMIAMTTNSSINVNPLEYEWFVFISTIDAEGSYQLG